MDRIQLGYKFNHKETQDMTKKQFKEMWKFDYNSLISTSNTKLNKSEIQTYGLSLTPDNITCKNAKIANCLKTCLVNTGHAKVYDSINKGRNKRKKLLYQDQNLFMVCLIDNINKALDKANGDKIAIRLNMYSDIQFENMYYKDQNIYQIFKNDNVQFYDYTKIVDRYFNLESKNLLEKCHLTFSYSPSPEYYSELKIALSTPMNIAFVYNGTKPDKFLNRTVYNGDLSDYRPTEGYNSLAIALKYKFGKDNNKLSNITI